MSNVHRPGQSGGIRRTPNASRPTAAQRPARSGWSAAHSAAFSSPNGSFYPLLLLLTLFITPISPAQTNQPFDGRKWNISTGNLSVSFIQASPVGSHPRPGVIEAPPSVESQRRWKEMGLVANEDYVAWGAVERTPGQWDWKQHDAVEQALHQAGLKYVVYDWAHFPPVWLREQQKQKRTLMRCLEHNQETYYLSIFDPRTIDWYDHFYRALSEHLGSRIDDVYACILGPYGEGNYPLNVPDWVNIGHCHEGYWCEDEYAIKSFQTALKKTYVKVSRLNRAWGAKYGAFEEVRPPTGSAGEFRSGAGVSPVSTGVSPSKVNAGETPAETG